MTEGTRPVTVLIAAMGGEGGAVLMNWIVAAANARALPVQSTSVPGVAQRTGATTYYIEMLPAPSGEGGGRRPVLSLYPGVGDIDVVVASELIEVARAMERGFVSPDRTTLIGCTHRFYSVAEKMHGTDGRYDGEQVLRAAPEMAQCSILFDGQNVARQAGSVVNAVLLGALAGSGTLPLTVADLQQAIRTVGKSVDSNLAGFVAGIEVAREASSTAVPRAAVETPRPAVETDVVGAVAADRQADRDGGGTELLERLVAAMPAAAQATLGEGTRRLIDYQDIGYAQLYLRRMESVSELDPDSRQAELTERTGRYLAVWMSYEDLIRVAQLKTRPARLARVRTEVAAEPDQIVRVIEYLKPGVEELCSILPPVLARPILNWAAKNRRMERLSFGVQVRSTTVSGFALLWLMAKLRPLRRLGYRYEQEQAMIEEWLELVRRAATLDVGMALEVAECARLVRGYGETHRTGVGHFRRIVRDLVEPALAAPPGSTAPSSDTAAAGDAIAAAREAALAEPETTIFSPLSSGLQKAGG